MDRQRDEICNYTRRVLAGMDDEIEAAKRRFAAIRSSIDELEDKILRLLSASEGNILDDPEAIIILDNAKKISDDIAAKQVITDATTKKRGMQIFVKTLTGKTVTFEVDPGLHYEVPTVDKS